MEKKNIFIIVLAVVSVLFFAAFLNSYLNAQKEKSSFIQEKSLRWDLEQKAKELTNGKRILEEKLDGALKSLETEKAQHEADKNKLEDLEKANQGIKEELTKLTKEKEALENKLKEAQQVLVPVTAEKPAQEKR